MPRGADCPHSGNLGGGLAAVALTDPDGSGILVAGNSFVSTSDTDPTDPDNATVVALAARLAADGTLG